MPKRSLEGADLDFLQIAVESAIDEARRAEGSLSRPEVERVALRELKRVCAENDVALTHDLARRIVGISLLRAGYGPKSGTFPAPRSSEPPRRDSFWKSLVSGRKRG